MADNIGTYYFQLAPTTEGLSNSISKALGGAGEEGGKSFSSGFGKALGTAGAVVGGVAMAVGGVASAVVGATNDVASYADEIDKMSQKMGISATAYQEWDAVMQHSGTSMESLKASMKTMANAALTGNEAFQTLGITEEEVANLSQEDLFARVISGLQEMGEGTERTYLAGQLLGRGATELGALLNTSAEDTQAMKDRVHELNGVLSDEAVKSGAAFQDQLQDMQTASQGLVRTMTAEFLPGITEVMGGFTDIFAGDMEKGAEEITSGIQTTLAKVTKELPKFLDVGSTIILAIADSIIQNLPSVISTGMAVIEKLLLGISDMFPDVVAMASTVIVEIVNGLSEAAPILIPAITSAILNAVQALIQNLPTILDAVLTLVKSLADSILNDGLPMLLDMLPDIIISICDFVISAIPQILQAVISIVLAIVENLPMIISTICDALPVIITSVISAILENLPMFIDAGIQLFVGLIGALPEIIIAIVKAIPQIVTGLVKGFKDNWPKIKESGKQIFASFCAGFMTIGNSIKEAVSKIWNAIKTAFSNFFSKIKEIGSNLITGLIDGIKSKITAVTDTVKNVATKVTDGFKNFFGIHSPSTLFRSYGQYLDEGLAEGIADGKELVDGAMDSLDTSVALDTAVLDSGYATRTVAQQSDSGLYDLLAQYLPYLAQENNVNVSLEGNADGLFNLVKRANNEYKKQNGGRSAFA